MSGIFTHGCLLDTLLDVRSRVCGGLDIRLSLVVSYDTALGQASNETVGSLKSAIGSNMNAGRTVL